MVRQNQHRIVLVAGRPTAASNLHGSVRERMSLIHPVHTMSSLECDQIKVPADKIQAGAQHLLQINLVFSFIFYEDTPGDDVRLRQNTVEQRDLHLTDCVL